MLAAPPAARGGVPTGDQSYINMDPKVPRRAPVQLELHGLTWRPRMPRRAGRTRQCAIERYS